MSWVHVWFRMPEDAKFQADERQHARCASAHDRNSWEHSFDGLGLFDYFVCLLVATIVAACCVLVCCFA